MNRPFSRKSQEVYAWEPRADFLPNSLRVERQNEQTEKKLLGAIIGAVIVWFVAYLLITVVAFGGTALITLEKERVSNLLASQAKYKDIRTIIAKTAQLEAVRSAGLASEIMWLGLFDSLRATLPTGAKFESIDIVALSALENAEASTVPLKGASIATINLSVFLPDLASVETWLADLPSIQGYADSTLNSAGTSGAGYVANVTINLNTAALANRFLPGSAPSPAATPTPTPTPKSTATSSAKPTESSTPTITPSDSTPSPAESTVP